MRQRREGPKSTRGSSMANRIVRTLQAPAPRGAKNHERVVDREQSCEDAPRASAGARQKQREASQFTFKIRTARQRERFDAHETLRGFAGDATHGATTGAIRHARSPQRVRCSCGKFARSHNGSGSTRTIPAEGASASFQNSHGATTGAIRHTRSPQRVRAQVFKIRTAPQRERCDVHETRRGFAVQFRNSHGATTRAMRRARNPQRVRCSV